MENAEPLLYYQECPGCKAAPCEDDGPSVKNLSLVAVIMLCSALPITILFPYIYFMVRDFHVAKSEADVGYYAGWIGASFMIGRFLTGIFWGLVADNYGRKPVILAGVLSVLVFNTMFGFSKTFVMAILARFFLGSMNGIVGTIQAVASELSGKKNQGLGMAVVSTTWGLGLVVGPAMGGFLAQPALKYPSLFSRDSLFAKFPYLLPPFCASAFAVPVLLACYFLPETLHKHGRADQEISVVAKPRKNGLNLLFSNKPLVSSIVLFSVTSLHELAHLEVFSLWAVRPKSQGGLAFTSSDTGRVLSVSGCGMLISQLLIFPRLFKRAGPVLIARFAAVFIVPLTYLFLYMPKLDGTQLWTMVLVVSTVKYMLMEAVATSLAIMVNRSVGQEQRGTANGISMCVYSLFKAVGPAAGGSVFAWSQGRFNASFLPGNQFVFTFIAFWMLLVALGTFIPAISTTTLS